MIPVLASQATASKRRMYFQVVQTDGITPATGEAGGQPQISTNGGTFADAGIGTLSHAGNGLCYADVTQAAVGTAGDVINGRYKSASTAEIPCKEMLRVVAYDPDDAAALGLTAVAATLTAVDTEVGAIKTKTDQLTFTNAGKVDAAVLAAGDFAQAAADKVWSTAARTLTAFSFAVDVSAAAVTLIWDKATSALTTVGSIGKHLVDQLAALITGQSASADPLTNLVPGSYASGTAGAALGRLGSTDITIEQPLSQDGETMDVRRGDSYSATDARSFDWPEPEAGWREMPVGSTVVFTMRRGSSLGLTKALTIVNGTGANKRVRLELTSAETTLFAVGTPAYRFDVELTLQGAPTPSRPITLVSGVVNVFEDQTHA